MVISLLETFDSGMDVLVIEFAAEEAERSVRGCGDLRVFKDLSSRGVYGSGHYWTVLEIERKEYLDGVVPVISLPYRTRDRRS